MVLLDAAAWEQPQVGLADALRILVVMAEKRGERYNRAADDGQSARSPSAIWTPRRSGRC
jgi:hypothetical protein